MNYEPVLKSGVDFREEMEKGVRLLESAVLIIQRLETEREYVFNGLFRDIGGYHNLFFDALGYSNKGKHDFQWFIAQRATHALQFYARKQGLEGNLIIVPTTPNTFPCQFVVKWDDDVVIRVNLLKQMYGLSSISYEEGQKKYIDSISNDIQEYVNEIERKKAYLENPWKHVRTLTDVILVLKKEYQKNIEHNIDFLNRRLQSLEKNKEEGFEVLYKVQQQESLREEKLEQLRPFFNSFDYKEVEAGSHFLY